VLLLQGAASPAARLHVRASAPRIKRKVAFLDSREFRSPDECSRLLYNERAKPTASLVPSPTRGNLLPGSIGGSVAAPLISKQVLRIDAAISVRA